MNKTIQLQAQMRDLKMEKLNALRQAGYLPAVVYGPGQPSQNLKVKLTDFVRVHKMAGESDLVMLELDGQSFNVLIGDIERQGDKILHVSFLQIQMDKPLEVEINLDFVGKAPAADQGGVMLKDLDALRVRCLPRDLVHAIEIDLSVLVAIGDEIRAGAIKLPKGLALVTNADELVVHIAAPNVEEVVEVTEIKVVDTEVKTEETPKK